MGRRSRAVGGLSACWLFTGFAAIILVLFAWFSDGPDDDAPLKVDCGLRAAVWTSTVRGRQMTGPQLGAVYEDAWDLAYREGQFKITLGQYKEKYVLTEHASFLLSENPGRKEKRKGMPLAPPKIDAPFDPARFHFGKVAPREVLLYFRDPDSSARRARHSDNSTAVVCADKAIAGAGAEHGGHPVLLNPFPLGPRSGLLVPWLLEHRSQLMTRDALLVGLRFARDLRPHNIKVGYNSLGAGASVNHLHFQTWQPRNSLPVETAVLAESVWVVPGARDTKVAVSTEHAPVSYIRWTFTTADPPASEYVAVAQSMQSCIDELIARSLPHNLVLSGTQAFLFARHAVVLLDGLINPGFPEVAGNIICPGEELYNTVTAARIEQHMLKHIRVDLSQFKLITDRCLATPE